MKQDKADKIIQRAERKAAKAAKQVEAAGKKAEAAKQKSAAKAEKKAAQVAKRAEHMLVLRACDATTKPRRKPPPKPWKGKKERPAERRRGRRSCC